MKENMQVRPPTMGDDDGSSSFSSSCCCCSPCSGDPGQVQHGRPADGGSARGGAAAEEPPAGGAVRGAAGGRGAHHHHRHHAGRQALHQHQHRRQVPYDPDTAPYDQLMLRLSVRARGACRSGSVSAEAAAAEELLARQSAEILRLQRLCKNQAAQIDSQDAALRALKREKELRRDF